MTLGLPPIPLDCESFFYNCQVQLRKHSISSSSIGGLVNLFWKSTTNEFIIMHTYICLSKHLTNIFTFSHLLSKKGKSQYLGTCAHGAQNLGAAQMMSAGTTKAQDDLIALRKKLK